jgi:predicted RNase H-like HicB family nuclease
MVESALANLHEALELYFEDEPLPAFRGAAVARGGCWMPN